MSLPYFKAVSTLLSMSEAHSSLCCEQSGQPPAASFLKPQHDKLAIHASLPHISTSVLHFWLVEQQERLVLWTAMTLLTKIYWFHFQFNVSVLWAHDAYIAIRIYDTEMEISPPVFKVMKCHDFFLFIFHLNNEIIPWKTNKHYQLTTDKIPYTYYFLTLW